MRRKSFLIVAVIFILGGAAFFALNKGSGRKRSSENVQTVQAVIGSIEETVEATGGVEPLNRVEIKPPVAGRIEKLLADEGAYVKAGAVLAWMSSADRAAILDAARAHGSEEVRRWEDTYKPTPIVAPLSGSVILRNVVVGQTVDGSTILFAMSDRLIVLANVDETDIGRVRPGMPATITLDSYPDQPIQGDVFQILHEGKIVSNVITYGVKIAPRSVPAFFRSQMTANISLIVKKKEDVLLLPAAALQAGSSGERYVFVPGAEAKPERRTVEIGLETGDQAEIVSGVQDGEKVLVMRKRYQPQQASSQSPLVMSGPRRSNQEGQSNTSRRAKP